MNKSIFYTRLLSLGLFLPAYETGAKGIDPGRHSEVENVQVTGKRPLALLKEEFMLAQYAVFDSFNTIMKDSDMHYVCTRDKRRGSNTRYKVCRDAFDIRIRRELLQEYSDRPGNVMENLNRGSASAQSGTKELEILKAKKLALIEKLYAQNTGFRASVVKMINAKNRYEVSHKATFGAASEYSKR